MANEYQIKIGEFSDCKTTEPETDGVYVVVYGLDFPGHINMTTLSFVKGCGWNCARRSDNSVFDDCKIEFDHRQPAYWAPIEIVKGPEVDDHE